MGKSAIIVDRSMMNAHKRTAVEEGIDGDAHIGDRAFDDKTDVKNEDFIYIY